MKLKTIYMLTLCLCPVLPAAADEISPEELERWFNSDTMDPPRYTEVNEGKLVFLAEPPEKKFHHHHNALTIMPQSLRDGWIRLEQCHENMDKVSAAQILFKKERIRDIRVLRYSNISKIWIEGASVQMENIGDNASLCIAATTRSLIQNDDGTYTLKNGPYMRRFFDGYFPLRVTMDLDYRDTHLELVHSNPVQQAGYKIVKQPDRIQVDTVFEGKLTTEFQFRKQSY